MSQSRHNSKNNIVKVNRITSNEVARIIADKILAYDGGKQLEGFDLVYRDWLIDYIDERILEIGVLNLPNGVVEYGDANQAGNDITYGTDWIWRIDNENYSLESPDTINFPNAASGKQRSDLVYGDADGNISKEPGNEVDEGEPFTPPPPPSGTVGIQQINVIDTGIEEAIDFSLASFVRFDIGNQGLNAPERLNARTNIQAVRKDGPDVIQIRQPGETGTIFWSFIDNNDQENLRIAQTGQGSETLVSFEMRNQSGDRTVRLLNGVPQTGLGSTSPNFHLRGAGTGTRTIVTWSDGNNDPLFSMIASGLSRFFNHAPLQPRSAGGSISERSTRRDELHLTYPVTVNETGKVNNYELPPENFAVSFGSGVTEVSGIIPNGDNKVIYVWSENEDGITLTEQDTDSSAANRFYEEIFLPFRKWVAIHYNQVRNLNRWTQLSGIATEQIGAYIYKQNLSDSVSSSGTTKQSLIAASEGSLTIPPDDMVIGNILHGSARITTSSIPGARTIEFDASLGGQSHGTVTVDATTGDGYYIMVEFRIKFVSGSASQRLAFLDSTYKIYDIDGELVAEKIQTTPSTIEVDSTTGKVFDFEVQVSDSDVTLFCADSMLKRI